MEKKNELVVAEMDEKSLAMFAVPEGEEEHLSQEELELPFLKLAQKGSAQVDEDKPEYIKGLTPGKFFNTVSGEVYDEESLKVQVHGYFQNYTIWKGPKGSGTYNGSMTPEEFRHFEATTKLTRDGGDMVQTVDGEDLRYTDTRNFIISLPEHPEDGIMLYPLSSTGCKVARKWNTLNNSRRVNGRPAKRYATIWALKTAGFESKGFNYKQVSSVKALGWATPELLEYGKSFEDFVKSIKETGVKYSESSDVEAEAVNDSDF
jgi:hypothetical protein